MDAVLVGELDDELGFGFTNKAGDLGGGAEVPDNGVADLKLSISGLAGQRPKDWS